MSSQPNLIDDEDFQQKTEKYEKNIEAQNASNAKAELHFSNPPPPAPTGILKHHGTYSGNSNTIEKDNVSSATKPLSIMSLEDRDVIVIDKADIRESTKNESNVIVVDKYRHQDIDLADLLGGNWPKLAGDAATILNKVQKAQQMQQKQQQQLEGSGGSSNSSVNSMSQSRVERIKSSNPLSHIGGMRHHDRNNQGETRRAATAPVNHSTIPAPIVAAALNGITTNSVNHMDSVGSSSAVPLTVNDVEYTLQDLGLGSMVEINLPDVTEVLYGVIRWIGVPPGAKNVMIGVELEDNPNDKKLLTTDGSFNCVPLFKCNEGRALFVTPDCCAKDRRFIDVEGATASAKINENIQSDSKMFGNVECPPVAGAVVPIKVRNLEDLDDICGKFKGIQGHHNSCYLDATLFSMFTFTSVFDSLLFRPPEPEDIPHYVEVQKVLREEIVNPLRKNIFVRADRVMKLRELLDKLSSVSGLTSEEKDPEEFLNSLLAQIMRVEPFLKLSSGQDAYFYQLFVEKDEHLSFPTVQQLFEQSFYSSDIKLKEVPSCLIIQMPRFGKNYKMYPRILPSQVLDVTDIIEDSPRQCSVCGKLAEYECRSCFGILQGNMGLESTGFCRNCLETVHMHAKRTNHTTRKLSVPQDFRIMAEHMTVQRLYMELFAVVCIETSHYVAFVKAGSGPDAPWCFFDSMADRKGERNGYNIPEMITVPDLPQWLSEEGARLVNETSSNDKMLPEHAKRLFCDAYMCMYQSSDVMMYR